MASTTDSLPPKRSTGAETAVALLSLLLAGIGTVVLQKIMSGPVPQGGLINNPIPLTIVDALLVMVGSIVSLIYVFARFDRAWNAAVVLGQVAVAVTSLLAIQGASILVFTPARGDFGGLVNQVMFFLVVILPIIVAAIQLVNLACLIAIRPEPQKPTATWVKRLALAMTAVLFAGGLTIAFGIGFSPVARAQAQVQRIKTGKASVGELTRALQSPAYDSRFWAVMELRKMGPEAKDAVPALAEALKGEQAISSTAAQALGNIGPDASPAIPALIEAIRQEQGKGKRSEDGRETETTFAWIAGDALSKIGPTAIPDLKSLLAHEDRFVRMTAAHALGTMGPPAKEAVPALEPLLNDEDAEVRRQTDWALSRIDNRPRAVDRRPAVPQTANRGNEPPPPGWTTQPTYTGDPRNRPPGTVVVTFDDGYCWLITESVKQREQRVDGELTIDAVITQTRRYEHLPGTHHVRVVEQKRDK